MKPDQPSTTAYRVAMRRAAHQILDRPVVLEDPIALRIVGQRGAAKIHEDPKRFDSSFGRALRLFLVARSRCAEDALAEAVALGVRQYVVLGAGLDTFAYRNPYAQQLCVYEVDMPSTQAWKRELLARTRIDVPASLTFVPVDFETQSLPEQLRAAGFRDDEPAFFSWLGVSMYLTRDAVLATLGYVARRPRGSGITFDYMLPPNRLPWLRRIGFYLVARRVAKAGEPWRTWFDPDDLARELRAMGFTRLEELDGPGLNERYFGGRERHLGGASAGRVMTAIVDAAPPVP